MSSLKGRRDTFAVLNSDGTVLYLSPAFSRLVVIEPSRCIWEVLTPHEKPEGHAEKPLEGLLEDKFCSVTYRYLLEPALANGTRILYLFEIEESLQGKLDDLYSRAFQLNPGLSAITTIANGEHLDVNQAWLNAMGYERSEVIGKTASELNIWEEGDESREKIIELFKDNGRIEGFEAKIRNKQGRLLDIIISAEQVSYRGHQLAFFTSHDITQLKLAYKKQNRIKQKADTLHRLAHADGLTGIANRRMFDQSIAKEWRRCGRQNISLGLLMIDIDYFKKYNDHYGHRAGDDCLVAVAKIISKQLKRPSDIACRYGGEEFACLLPDTNAIGAMRVASAIQLAVQKLELPHDASPISRYITLSIGVATIIPSSDKSEDELMQVADAKLYEAKEKGRARIEAATHLLPVG